MKHLWPLLATSVFLFATPAAADPKPEAQSRMAAALGACDRGLERYGDAVASLPEYRRNLDESKKADPSITTWNGKLHGIWVVSEAIGKCERELPAKAKVAERGKALRPSFDAAFAACGKTRTERSNDALATYKRARAALIAANGGSATFSLPDAPNASQDIARCDTELPPLVAETEKRLAENRANDARRKTENDAREAATAARWTSLHGDRLAVAKEHGFPPMPDREMPRATKWVYPRDVVIGQTSIQGENGASAEATHTVPCTVTIVFKGDKRVSTTPSKKGCTL